MVVVDAAVQDASEPAFDEGHTAGLTQEAPIGNNNELDPGSFDAHVRSISDTWLRFPVGSGYAYSNLGIDLAGYILERVQDKPFAAVMRDSLLGPLGMERSTFDRTAIRSTSDRAVGHADHHPEPPVEVPMTAARGLYSSVADLARFLAFQLNDGSMTVGCSSIRSRSRSSGRSRPRTPTHTRAPSDGECMEAAQRHPARLASNI
jgi:CubicO group peptidase (beta-lactamase class C family)